MAMSERQRWRAALALDLGIFNLALIVFALLPPWNLTLIEQGAILLAAGALIGVVAHALPRVHLPGEGWAYLASGAAGAYVTLAYSMNSTAPYYIKAPFIMFLLSGVASGYSAHVIDGRRRERGRAAPSHRPT